MQFKCRFCKVLQTHTRHTVSVMTFMSEQNLKMPTQSNTCFCMGTTVGSWKPTASCSYPADSFCAQYEHLTVGEKSHFKYSSPLVIRAYLCFETKNQNQNKPKNYELDHKCYASGITFPVLKLAPSKMAFIFFQPENEEEVS